MAQTKESKNKPADQRGLAGQVIGDTSVCAVNQTQLMYRGYEIADLAANATFEEVVKSLKKRDNSDKNRRYSPLRFGRDSLLINTTRLSITGCFLKVKKIIDRKLDN